MSQIQDALVERLSRLVVDCRDAVLAKTWLYPLLGIYYFVANPSLYQSVAPALLKALAVSAGITFGLIFFTYMPQMAFCALFSGIFAPLTAAVMVLAEAYILVWMVGRPLMLPRVQDRLFDQVMVMEGHESLVARGREIRMHGRDVRVLGKEINIKPGLVDDLTRGSAIRYLITLPLNSIPGIGTAMFLMYNGEKQGPGYHARYFELKGWDEQERNEFVHQRKAAYTAFGAVGVVLHMIPFLGLMFKLTTTVGSALWASKMERTHERLAGSGRHVEKAGERSINIE
ncbi:Regulator of rDNA transcription protein 8 [Leucoagaricus sp. SymC.cos]|nr:Regulator of rDNA transcription protein 8 [Leucoagaricus sp. SymC.cos]